VKTLEEEVVEMNEKGVFRLLYQRELCRGTIRATQCVARIIPHWRGYDVKWIRYDEMTDDLPIFGSFEITRETLGLEAQDE